MFENNVDSTICGVRDHSNPKYLALARQHGFSLHSIEADILNLSKLLEGETITTQEQQYFVKKDGLNWCGRRRKFKNK